LRKRIKIIRDAHIYIIIAMNTKNAITALPAINALPIELINKIINYTGVVTFYKGKYYDA
jgi:hypothetical protein